jgi:hypothetical protein
LEAKWASWSNIRIGNTTSTISEIGCLVISIAILIEKSEVENKLVPFNPGVFVDEYGFSEYIAKKINQEQVRMIFPKLINYLKFDKLK